MMKKITRIFILIALSALLIPSCDIVEEPYLKPVKGDEGEPTEKVRKVLLEDFTGHKCPNCPEAAEIAHTLKSLYGEQLVLLTLHSGYYAEPDATGAFTDDFRTQAGNELDTYFNIYLIGYPMGMVNRAEYNGMPVVIKDDWQTAVGIQLEKEAEAGIEITNAYNAGTRKLDCLLESQFYNDMEGTFNICVFITESSIISPQQTEQEIDSNYVHNHVLRATMNGTWGSPVGETGQAPGGSVLNNNFSYTLPEAWVAENCSVIAFIYNTTTNEVVQAEENSIVE